MNVPLTLPDLPGIVDDERFTLDLNFQSPIAPSSAVATPTIHKDLASLASTEPEKSQSTEKIAPDVQNPSAIIPNLPDISSPPVTLSKVEVPAKEIHTVLEIPSQSVPPPPPPPPPPPASPPEENEQPKQAMKKPASAKPPAVEDRSNLMAAIRDAGGLGKAKLRQTMPADKSKDRWSSASVGGDLMADLHAKLSLRRKGIAGSATNALIRMSSMIPPPPKPNESSTSDKNSATSECESQDDDGWEE